MSKKTYFRFPNKKSLIGAVLTLALLVSTIGIPVSLAEAADVIVFADSSLEQALLDAGVDSAADGSITEGEMAAYTPALALDALGISDLGGLEFATGITSLDLSTNNIEDISALGELTQLTTLDVSGNYLDLTAGSDNMMVIDALTVAGCTVTYEPQRVHVTAVSLDTTELSMFVDDTATFTASVFPEDATDKTVSWSSSNTDVATVSDGVVTVTGVGDAIITVTTTDNSISTYGTVSVEAGVLSTSVYTLEGGYLSDVAKLTSPEQLKYNLDNNPDEVFIYNSDGTLYDGTRVTTGMVVKLITNDTVYDEATIIVDGDVNGDGMIAIDDYTLARLHILGLTTLQGDFFKACDMSRDDLISICDYTLMRLDILGLMPVGSTLPDLPEVTNPNIRAFLDMALAQQGKPYVWSEEGPDSFDCSGYVYYCLTQVGYSIYRTTANSYSQWAAWDYVDRNALQPGDLMFYHSDSIPGRIGHIGIYLGNGYHIHASSTYECIIICKLDGWYDEMLSHGRRVW